MAKQRRYSLHCSRFLFVEETADVASFVASQNVALLVDAEGKRLSVCAEKAELAAEFAHLLK